jgi:hypothetical protein
MPGMCLIDVRTENPIRCAVIQSDAEQRDIATKTLPVMSETMKMEQR